MAFAAGFARALPALSFGDRTWAGAGLARDVARVALVDVARTGAALILFFGTAMSVLFSLLSVDNSSLPRLRLVVFLVVAGCFEAAADNALAVMAAAAATRVFRAAAVVYGGDDLPGGVVQVGFVSAAFAAGALRTTAFDGAAVERAGLVVPAALSRFTSGICRIVAGIRLTRLSRRDRRLAHCASHIARSFS